MERQPDSEPPVAPLTPRRERRRSSATALFAGGALAAFAGAGIVAHAPDSPEATLVATLAAEIVFTCAALGGALLIRRDLRRTLRLELPRTTGAELAALAIGFVCVSHALSLALSSFELRDTGTLGEIDRIVAETQGPSRLLAFLALGLAPAFGEELLFRGLIQQSAIERLGTARAIALSAACFAAIHLDPVQSPAAFVLGLYLGTVVELGGGLAAAILCHAANNSLAVFGPPVGWTLGPPALWTLAAILLAIGLGLLGWVARRAMNRRGEDVDPLGGAPSTGAA